MASANPLPIRVFPRPPPNLSVLPGSPSGTGQVLTILLTAVVSIGSPAKPSPPPRPRRDGIESTYSELTTADGALRASSPTIHVTAKSMQARRTPACALPGRPALAWPNVVRATTISFDREPFGRWLRKGLEGVIPLEPVTTVLVQSGTDNKTSVTSTSMNVDYNRFRASAIHFDGAVTMPIPTRRSQPVLDVYLLSKQQLHRIRNLRNSPATPIRLERGHCKGNVVIAQPTRRAAGEHSLTSL